MDINIGDKIKINNPYTNEDEEYLEDFAIIKKVKYMNFIEAIKTIKRNENLGIKREEGTNVFSSGWSGKLYVDDRKFYKPITVDDILAEDWYVVKNEKLHSFEEALKALKNGATIYRKSCVGQKHRKRDRQFLFYSYDDFEANDWIIIDKEETK